MSTTILTLADFDNAALFAEIERRRAENDRRVPTPPRAKSGRNAATAPAAKAARAPKVAQDPLAKARDAAADAFVGRIMLECRKTFAKNALAAHKAGKATPKMTCTKHHGDAEFASKASKRIAYYYGPKFTPNA